MFRTILLTTFFGAVLAGNNFPRSWQSDDLVDAGETEYEREFLANQEHRINSPGYRVRSRAHGAGNPACVKLGIAVDRQLIVNSGGTLDGARAYLEKLVQWTSREVYEPTFNVQLRLGEVYDGSNASYMQNVSGTSGALDKLVSHFNSNGIAERNKHQLMVGAYGENLGGGVAYLGGLYNHNYGYSISAGLNDDNTCDFALDSCNRWSKIVFAHEIGHNFGGPHTHDIGVDQCGNGGACARPGTIMSYCHLCGGLENIALKTFHQEVQDRINGELNSSDISGTQCALGPTPPPTTPAPTPVAAPTPTPAPVSQGSGDSSIVLRPANTVCATASPALTRAECEAFAREGQYFDEASGADVDDGCFTFKGDLPWVLNGQNAPNGCIVSQYFRRRLWVSSSSSGGAGGSVYGGDFVNLGGQNSSASGRGCSRRTSVYWSQQNGSAHSILQPVCALANPTPAPTSTPAPTTPAPTTPAPTATPAPTTAGEPCVRGAPGCDGDTGFEPEAVDGCDCAKDYLVIGDDLFHNPAPGCSAHQAEAGFPGAYCYVVDASACVFNQSVAQSDLVESVFMDGAFWRECDESDSTDAPTPTPAPTNGDVTAEGGFPSRCGANFMDNGFDGKCSTDHFNEFGELEAPCCSPYGWCGNGPEWCDCPDCVDYSPESDGETSSEDGEVTDQGCDATKDCALIATFNKTGCPNQAPEKALLGRWRRMIEVMDVFGEEMVRSEMYATCLYNDRDEFRSHTVSVIINGVEQVSGATRSQRDLCCGEGKTCEVSCEEQDAFWCPASGADADSADSSDDATPSPTPVTPTPPPTPRPTYGDNAGSGSQDYWNFGLYLHADNNLEGAGVKDLQEFGEHLDGVSQINGQDALRPTILIDRSRGYSTRSLHHKLEGPNGQQLSSTFSGTYQINWESQDHHWVATKTQDEELNLDDPKVLAAFVDQAYSNDAQHNMLDLWNHGSGWMGYGGDGDSNGSGMALADITKGIRDGLNGRRLDILGFDACLMADFTVLMAIGADDLSNYVVASEHLEPGDGWNYDAWKSVTQGQLNDPATFASGIVDGFINHYQNTGSLTLAVFDMRKRQQLASTFEALFAKLIAALQAKDATVRTAISRARGETQEIDLAMYGGAGMTWVDAGSFLAKLQRQLSGCDALSGLVDAALAAYNDFVVAERSVPEEGYTGFTLFWPGTSNYMNRFRGMQGAFGGPEGAANDSWVELMNEFQSFWDASQAKDGFCSGQQRLAFVQNEHFDLDLKIQRCEGAQGAVATLVASAGASRVKPEVAVRSVTWNEHQHSDLTHLTTVEHIEMQVVAELVDGTVESIVPDALQGQALGTMQTNTQFSTKWDGRVPVFHGPSSRDLDSFALVFSRISYGHAQPSCDGAAPTTEAVIPVTYYPAGHGTHQEPIPATVRLFAKRQIDGSETFNARLFISDNKEVKRFDCTYGDHGSVMSGAKPCGHIDAFYHRIPTEKEFFAGGLTSVQPESTLFAWSPELSVTLKQLEDVQDRLRADFRHGSDDIDAVIRYTVRDEFEHHNVALAEYSPTQHTASEATPLSFVLGE